MTRAEAVSMLAKAFPATGKGSSSANGMKFQDVPDSYWAAGVIRSAAQKGWINGYPDGTFRPGQAVTRREMAVLAAKAAGMQPVAAAAPPFRDVGPADWAAPYVHALKQRGWIKGADEAGHYNPDAWSSRAEWTTLVYRMIRS
ncbi:S-layer homology domain-containing protein [Paenibacillus protaetiae]